MTTDNQNRINDNDTTESTESVDTAVVGGKFVIVLDVKKINTNESIEE